MTNRVTFFGALALAIGCSVAGYQYAAALYGEDIAALREDYASRSQALEEKYREKERVQHQSLVEAWEERDKALANVERLSDDVDRGECQDFCVWGGYSRGSPTRLPFVVRPAWAISTG